MYMTVPLRVKPEHLETFKAATLENGRNTRQEPGNLQFELWQHKHDSTAFVLVERYENQSALDAHLASQHFTRWKMATTGCFESDGPTIEFSGSPHAHYHLLFPEAGQVSIP